MIYAFLVRFSKQFKSLWLALCHGWGYFSYFSPPLAHIIHIFRISTLRNPFVWFDFYSRSKTGWLKLVSDTVWAHNIATCCHQPLFGCRGKISGSVIVACNRKREKVYEKEVVWATQSGWDQCFCSAPSIRLPLGRLRYVWRLRVAVLDTHIPSRIAVGRTLPL
jgi:hypothetical protein